MSTRKIPNQMEWQALYEAADHYKNARCWEWVSEDDLFGITDPESGVINAN
ncbi:MAG TPA: hypothetical protein VHY08_01495 [Bacillota bacterium]|nr:hypothetical protein [Bacillota bacterium]